MKISQRTFVSFDEPCQYKCKHCYTYDIKRPKIRTDDEILDEIADNIFDVIYVSQKNDNFSIPLRGINICTKAFNRYHTHIFIITRNIFNTDEINKLIDLRNHMAEYNKILFIAISLNSLSSYFVSENTNEVPTPRERIRFIDQLNKNGFNPILMLRPIFPLKIIPISECIEIINLVKESAACVVSSGLGINNDILKRLGMKKSDFVIKDNQEYLQGAIDCPIYFINVDDEINAIREKCLSISLPFFEHSLPALNYIYGRLNL